MAEEPKEKWLNYLALTTVILAVCATLSTFKGAGYSTRAVLSQSQATNQWAYYQAKGIKVVVPINVNLADGVLIDPAFW